MSGVRSLGSLSSGGSAREDGGLTWRSPNRLGNVSPITSYVLVTPRAPHPCLDEGTQSSIFSVQRCSWLSHPQAHGKSGPHSGTRPRALLALTGDVPESSRTPHWATPEQWVWSSPLPSPRRAASRSIPEP